MLGIDINARGLLREKKGTCLLSKRFSETNAR